MRYQNGAWCLKSPVYLCVGEVINTTFCSVGNLCEALPIASKLYGLFHEQKCFAYIYEHLRQIINLLVRFMIWYPTIIDGNEVQLSFTCTGRAQKILSVLRLSSAVFPQKVIKLANAPFSYGPMNFPRYVFGPTTVVAICKVRKSFSGFVEGVLFSTSPTSLDAFDGDVFLLHFRAVHEWSSVE